jgi:AraC-like DNA-binding protein
MMSPNRYWKVDLSAPTYDVHLYGMDLQPQEQSYSPEPGRWAIFYYLHDGVFGLGTRAYPYSCGSLVVVPSGVRISHDVVGPNTLHYFIEFSLSGTSGPSLSLPLLSQQEDPNWLVDEIERTRAMVGRTNAHRAAFLWALLWRISKPASLYREFIELYEAEKFVGDNLSRSVKVEEVAQHVGVSSRTLLRMFRATHGVTVEEYIAIQKVETARRLLATTNQPIKAISARIGIGSYQHFNKLIRESTGLSPNAYREQAFKNRG